MMTASISIGKAVMFRKNSVIRCFRGTEKIFEGLNRHRHKYSSTRSLSSPSSQPVVELREDFLFPQHSKSYFDHFEDSQNKHDAIHPSNLCFMSRPELGGPLHIATHVYYFSGGLAELQEQRKKEEHFERKDDILAYIQSQQSSVYVEAPLVKEGRPNFVIGLENTTVGSYEINDVGTTSSNRNNEDRILELRRYNLKLGYDTVPKFLELYGAGLPSKLEAPGTDATTSLVTLLYSEVGRLNEVIEIWSHGGGVPAMEKSRIAARKAQEWRRAIASIADLAIEFRSTIHRPMLVASPMIVK
jgi:hypothetical protein